MVERAIHAVCVEFGVSLAEIRSPLKSAAVTNARQMLCVLLGHMHPRAVAGLINKDRTAVISASNSMRQKMNYNRDLQRIYDRLLQTINDNEMTLKMPKERQEELLRLITMALSAYEPENKAEKLLYSMVSRIRIKLGTKLERLRLDRTHSQALTMTRDEALAFACWYEQIAAEIDPREHMWALTIASTVMGEIDRQYG